MFLQGCNGYNTLTDTGFRDLLVETSQPAQVLQHKNQVNQDVYLTFFISIFPPIAQNLKSVKSTFKLAHRSEKKCRYAKRTFHNCSSCVMNYKHHFLQTVGGQIILNLFVTLASAVPWWWRRRRACPPDWSGSSCSGCLCRSPGWAGGCRGDQPASCSPSGRHLGRQREPSGPSDGSVALTTEAVPALTLIIWSVLAVFVKGQRRLQRSCWGAAVNDWSPPAWSCVLVHSRVKRVDWLIFSLCDVLSSVECIFMKVCVVSVKAGPLITRLH